ncbi:hypothetical protein LIA77_03851 [Sarocladium implicatum]|nr:hypothetical protein LIA77_03851 [Sarocladium implicatum]
MYQVPRTVSPDELHQIPPLWSVAILNGINKRKKGVTCAPSVLRLSGSFSHFHSLIRSSVLVVSPNRISPQLRPGKCHLVSHPQKSNNLSPSASGKLLGAARGVWVSSAPDPPLEDGRPSITDHHSPRCSQFALL